MTASKKPTLYFGYGSNLWLHQMSTRCPESTYLGIARLNGYKWLINERGYANVVQDSSSSSPSSSTARATPHVYGLVYSLSPTDEARLDKNEGVPVAYTKEYLDCDFWSVTSTSSSQSASTTDASYPRKIDTSRPPDETGKPLLVYIDRVRTAPSVPRDEYVYRMNRGIDDALKCGVPEEYVRDVMRVFIPADDDNNDGDQGKTNGNGNEREKMAEYAKQQAAAFRDESGVIE